MKAKYKTYLKLNIVSLIFIAISFISITLAWFAYSGLASVETVVGVKAWYIEFKSDTVDSNDIVISLSDIYPGMETVSEVVNINNKGDSDAQISYSILSARILDEEMSSDTLSSGLLIDKLSHEYPFHINVSLSKNYATAKNGSSVFTVSVSWPLDSGDNSSDSLWGSDAYQFQIDEQEKHDADSNYQIRPSLKIVISVKAEQYITNNDSSDIKYNLGDLILFDVENNEVCSEVGDTCLRTHVIDGNNTLGDDTVTLLPDLFNTYTSGMYTDYNTLYNGVISTWNKELLPYVEPLTVEDVLKAVSTDVLDSVLVREGMSDSIIGNLMYEGRMSLALEKVRDIEQIGYYRFLNEKYSYFSTGRCYWMNSEYDSDKAFALIRMNETHSKVYGNLKTEECQIVPVIRVPKNILEKI